MGSRGQRGPRSVCSLIYRPHRATGEKSLEWKYGALKREKNITPSTLNPPPPPHHSQQQRKEQDDTSGPRNFPELGVSVHSAMNACTLETRICSCVWAFGDKTSGENSFCIKTSEMYQTSSAATHDLPTLSTLSLRLCKSASL